MNILTGKKIAKIIRRLLARRVRKKEKDSLVTLKKNLKRSEMRLKKV